ncbi:hypothetical protein SAMD00019534_025220 [Acytostelium subglobosum LB1]|uniref:hypothetical protein n=1 Tax=Acytostelium subglobosum LB1 TaxID=1410327 RepID=UPI0006447E20|nr:hypothetical protein SAMD00019534_025220 [Acytostelium subglobosum LB1]GAM19347.1 hypothetical protein SAMD00019534_025220 [Acytostelium subglobosum LB1]|eukprot:XP_012757274.1 hypothetical protein SAMD00019534_025220 [Acytostelium subglobosum LB1]
MVNITIPLSISFRRLLLVNQQQRLNRVISSSTSTSCLQHIKSITTTTTSSQLLCNNYNNNRVINSISSSGRHSYSSSTSNNEDKDTSTTTKNQQQNKQEKESQQVPKYLAVFRNVPDGSVSLTSSASEMAENGAKLMNSPTYFDPNVDKAVPRPVINLVFFPLNSPLIIHPFSALNRGPSLYDYAYQYIPALFNRSFPDWIDIDDFMKHSLLSMFRAFDYAYCNDMQKMKEITTENGMYSMLWVRDVFYTHKIMDYRVAFTKCRTGFIDSEEDDGMLKVTVHYLLSFDLDVKVSKNGSYPIANDGESTERNSSGVANICMIWTTPLPKSKNEDDLDWKIEWVYPAPTDM